MEVAFHPYEQLVVAGLMVKLGHLLHIFKNQKP